MTTRESTLVSIHEQDVIVYKRAPYRCHMICCQGILCHSSVVLTYQFPLPEEPSVRRMGQSLKLGLLSLRNEFKSGSNHSLTIITRMCNPTMLKCCRKKYQLQVVQFCCEMAFLVPIGGDVAFQTLNPFCLRMCFLAEKEQCMPARLDPCARDDGESMRCCMPAVISVSILLNRMGDGAVQWCVQHHAVHFRVVGSCIRWRGSHLGNERLSIVGCRDEIRAVECTIRRLGGSQHGLHSTNPKSLLNCLGTDKVT